MSSHLDRAVTPAEDLEESASGPEPVVAEPRLEPVEGQLRAESVAPGVRRLVIPRGSPISSRRRGWLVRRMLLLADVVGLTSAFAAASIILPSGSGTGNALTAAEELALFLLSLPVWVLLIKLYGLYDRDEERAHHSTPDDLVGVLHVVTVGVWLFVALTLVTDYEIAPLLERAVLFWALAVLLISAARAGARAMCRRRGTYVQNTLILGADETGRMIGRKLLQNPDYGAKLVGFVDERPPAEMQGLEQIAYLGRPNRLAEIVRDFDVERVVVAFVQGRYERTLALIRQLRELQVQVDIVPRLYESVGPSVDVHTIEGLPLVGLPPVRLSRSSQFVKRGVDITVSAVGLVLLSPLLGALAAWIKLDSRGPVLYRSQRAVPPHLRRAGLGRDGTPFRIFKFRTMYLQYCRGPGYGAEGAEKEFDRLMSDPLRRLEFDTSHKLADDPRVTRAGRFLRRTSLDELPQLINVLLGHLSLIGPRPITLDELPRFGPEAGALLHMKPGLTGYWQINGRSHLTYDERVRLDLAYVNSWSLKLDLMILAKTLRVLVSRQGAF